MTYIADLTPYTYSDDESLHLIDDGTVVTFTPAGKTLTSTHPRPTKPYWGRA